MLECLVLGLPHISGEAVASLGFELFFCFHKMYSGIEATGELQEIIVLESHISLTQYKQLIF